MNSVLLFFRYYIITIIFLLLFRLWPDVNRASFVTEVKVVRCHWWYNFSSHIYLSSLVISTVSVHAIRSPKCQRSFPRAQNKRFILGNVIRQQNRHSANNVNHSGTHSLRKGTTMGVWIRITSKWIKFLVASSWEQVNQVLSTGVHTQSSPWRKAVAGQCYPAPQSGNMCFLFCFRVFHTGHWGQVCVLCTCHIFFNFLPFHHLPHPLVASWLLSVRVKQCIFAHLQFSLSPASTCLSLPPRPPSFCFVTPSPSYLPFSLLAEFCVYGELS